ncbi:hypothetical protein GCM10011494_04720 [Novosphingobium endophyticum]|uniref:Uncharacterized protein n=1 Tax=Novosphingobium endophyticum TaxID=1955250 RepID=A0A916TPE6_9SPHN|nr:hypothetical protein [Novosphingobium endophyticum]GGB89426.1 hypothetical protein GCM10011494_04720 [Novosphingobium endophyticum]
MTRSYIARVIAPAVASLGLVAQPALAAAPACWNADEISAARLHAFQTTLLVGAMRCRDAPDTLNSYNAFVQARKASLEASRTVLQAHFIRALGPENGMPAFAAYETEVGNRASIIDHDTLRCEAVATYSRLASSASENDLYTLARISDNAVASELCQPQRTAALPAGPAPQAALQETTAAPAAEADQTLTATPPPEALPETTLAQAPSEAVQPPTTQLALAKQEASPQTIARDSSAGAQSAANEVAKVDPATALEDAARALAAAASSLRGASSANQ